MTAGDYSRLVARGPEHVLMQREREPHEDEPREKQRLRVRPRIVGELARQPMEPTD